MTDPDKSLQEQVDSLQAQLRRLESRGGRHFWLCFILAIALGGVAWLAYRGHEKASYALYDIKELRKKNDFDHITARSLTIHGDDGKELVSMGGTKKQGGHLFVKNVTEETVVAIRCNNGREGRVDVCDLGGREVAQIRSAGGRGTVEVYNLYGIKVGSFRAGGTQSGLFLLYDHTGRLRDHMSASPAP